MDSCFFNSLPSFILIQEGGYIFDEFNDSSSYIKTDF